jgi:hypothetical protein
MSTSKPNNTIKKKLPAAWSYVRFLDYILPLDTCDLVNIWLGSPSIPKVLYKYLEREVRILLSVEHLFAMDFQSGASDFYHLFPLILFISVSGALGAYLDVFHSVFGTLLAVGCFFAVNYMFAFAGHSVLHLGEAMDEENVSKTRVDTDIMSTLAFLGMLASESLGQLILFTLVGGYLGFFLSLIVTLAMLGAGTMMNHIKVTFTIYDERFLQKAVQAKRRMRMDEKDRKIAKLESTIEGLHFQLHAQQQKSEERKRANICFREADIQKQQELQRYETALRNASATTGKLSETNKLLQDTLAQAYKSHDEALTAKDRHCAEEFAKEKAHAETLARNNMLVELRNEIEASKDAMSTRYTNGSAIMQERCNRALARKDKEHAEALAMKERHHLEVLTKEKADAQAEGRTEAINYCKQFHESNMQAAERRHTEALADAVSERDKLHKEALVKKEKEFEEAFRKLKNSHAESQQRNMRFYHDFIKDKNDDHARGIAEKDQELADMKARVDRYPEVWLAEDNSEDWEDSEDGEDGEDEGYRTMVDNDEAGLQNGNEAKSQDKEDIDNEDAESQDYGDTESHDDDEAESEYEDEDEDLSLVDYAGSDVEFCVDGDDSEDELRQWALVDVDSDVE